MIEQVLNYVGFLLIWLSVNAGRVESEEINFYNKKKLYVILMLGIGVILMEKF